MSNSLSWPEIFRFFRDPSKPTHKQMALRMAEDFGLSSFEVSRQWIARQFVPIWHWPRLLDILEQRHGVIVSYRQLVEATIAQRSPRRQQKKDAA